MIWLQHGFIAGGGWYDKLATALAEQTNSIVVAPTLSSNPLTSGGKWLNGDVMQHAVADLLADRTALTASAAAAAGHPVELPDRIVLAGHSAAADWRRRLRVTRRTDGAINDILGVVMFDGVPVGDALSTRWRNWSGSTTARCCRSPRHPYIWNNSGQGTDQLVAARPDRFDGVRLANGSHIDSMQASDPLIELAGNLFAGYARAENQLAVQTLAVGWINDMYFGTHDGIYGTAGETLAIGDATADVLGGAVGGSLAVETTAVGATSTGLTGVWACLKSRWSHPADCRVQQIHGDKPHDFACEPLTDGPRHVNLLGSMFEWVGKDASQRLIGPGMRSLCGI